MSAPQFISLCPCCGGCAEVIRSIAVEECEEAGVRCEDCGLMLTKPISWLSGGTEGAISDAIEAWNLRDGEEA